MGRKTKKLTSVLYRSPILTFGGAQRNCWPEGNTEQEAFAAIQRHLVVYIPFNIVTRMIPQLLSLETRHNYIEFQGPVSQ